MASGNLFLRKHLEFLLVDHDAAYEPQEASYRHIDLYVLCHIWNWPFFDRRAAGRQFVRDPWPSGIAGSLPDFSMRRLVFVLPACPKRESKTELFR